MPSRACPPLPPSVRGVSIILHVQVGGRAHQSAHGAVQSMPVVAAELGVGALERRVTVSLGLLDTAGPNKSAIIFRTIYHFACAGCRGSTMRGYFARETEGAHPFLWFFFDWLCWDEFLDSAFC